MLNYNACIVNHEQARPGLADTPVRYGSVSAAALGCDQRMCSGFSVGAVGLRARLKPGLVLPEQQEQTRSLKPKSR